MNRRILTVAEGRFSPLKSKTANGAIAYLPGEVVGIVDSTKAGMTAQQVLGYGGEIPVLRNLEEGLRLQPTHMLVGIAPPGGRLPELWRDLIRQSIKARLHILSGLHTILSEDAEFTSLAQEYSISITDYRKTSPESEVVAKGTWRNRTANVILTVGTDCNIGKMTTILEIQKDLVQRGVKSDFVATGQTGMMIRGRGVAVDSLIGDYIAGAIELEVDRSVAEGYEFILVEGQGALTHIGYSSVTLGLLHGTMPDAMILCHQPTRLKDDYGLVLPGLKSIIELHEGIVRFFRETKVIAIGLNSVGLSDEESQAAADRITQETGLPAIDAFRFSPKNLTDAVLNYFASRNH